MTRTPILQLKRRVRSDKLMDIERGVKKIVIKQFHDLKKFAAQRFCFFFSSFEVWAEFVVIRYWKAA